MSDTIDDLAAEARVRSRRSQLSTSRVWPTSWWLRPATLCRVQGGKAQLVASQRSAG